MNWSEVLGMIGSGTGIVSLFLAWRAWVRSGEALDESRLLPVRQAQHAQVSELWESIEPLNQLLRQINDDVPLTDATPTRVAESAYKLRILVERMTGTVITDPQLKAVLDKLRQVVIATPPVGGLAAQLEAYCEVYHQFQRASLALPGDDDYEEWNDEFADLRARQTDLAKSIGSATGAALELIPKARERLRAIQTSGLGKIESSKRSGSKTQI